MIEIKQALYCSSLGKMIVGKGSSTEKFPLLNLSWHAACYNVWHPLIKSQCPIYGDNPSLAKITDRNGSVTF